MNDTEGHSLQQTTLRFHAAQSAALSFTVIETLHRIPGVLTAAVSGAGVMTVSHDSAVPSATIETAAKSVDASAALVGRGSERVRDVVSRVVAPTEAVRVGVALVLTIVALEGAYRIAGAGFVRQFSVMGLTVVFAVVLMRPFLIRRRPR